MMRISRRKFCILLAAASAPIKPSLVLATDRGPSPDNWSFNSPPESARPYVLWMWMGSNISQQGITRDLEAMKQAGIGGATIMSLADTTTPWAGMILKSPTPHIIAFTEPWWAMLRHAASEARRLGLELSLHNCAGYESSGGTWITPEMSMQEVVWSTQRVTGGMRFSGTLKRATVDPHPHALFPDVYIPSLGRVDKPIVAGRQSYYRDIAVIAVPAEGVIAKERILELSSKMNADGAIEWDCPAGEWNIYRLGHTTTGAMIQPAQWDAMGLECDKMSKEAVSFHVEHVLAGLKTHLGDLLGTGLTTLYFDSYEAGDPTWTPKMREEFQQRRGYDIVPWLPVLAGRTIGSEAETGKFKKDFERTVHDLFRDCYWATPGPLAHAAGLQFAAEPYEGPWEISEVVHYLDTPTVEFWTHDNRYSPVAVDPVVTAARIAGRNIIASEAFTTDPKQARWNEHPAWLKPIGDAAFCAGINRFALHHFVQQPWGDQYQPGNTMGQWGVHFGRNQTWWKPGRAWFTYLWRCQAMLQRGQYVAPAGKESVSFEEDKGGVELKSIHRRDGDTDIFFIANVGSRGGTVHCEFPVQAKQPELWDPVWGSMRDLPDFKGTASATEVALDFAPGQSFFLVFQKPVAARGEGRRNFPALTAQTEVSGPWTVAFDPHWGGPASTVFEHLEDWTQRPETGIRYYSGTAVYKKTIALSAPIAGKRVYLDIGTVKHIAEVTVNGTNLGVLWTAPWRIDVTEAIKVGENRIEIAVTNVWANRLIGDEHEPADVIWELGDPKFNSGYFLKEFPDWFLKGEARPSQGRYTFVTWNYFTKDSPLEASGLMGPVRFLAEI